ncbi:hypothetical protein I4U23_002581 [Adineta vaga]|nr:hypothetical protein I4U23_002581 [Adineta vaga]
MDTVSIIIVVCLIITAVVAIAVCILIYRSHRNRHQKFLQPRNSMDSQHYSRSRATQENYTIDFSTTYRNLQERRLCEHSPISELFPPSYTSSIYQTRREQLPLFLPIHTTRPFILHQCHQHMQKYF